VTWNPTTVSGSAGACRLIALNAPPAGTSGGGSGGGGSSGGGTSGGSSNSTGTRVAACVAATTSASQSSWITLPAPFNGLDVKIFYNSNFSTTESIYRNRFQATIHFNESVYPRGANPPAETQYRHDLAAGESEGPPGAETISSIPRGGGACVIVDKVRFGQDTGPYYGG
jgi:hypothetical protein